MSLPSSPTRLYLTAMADLDNVMQMDGPIPDWISESQLQLKTANVHLYIKVSLSFKALDELVG